jgi:hypothetical protein
LKYKNQNKAQSTAFFHHSWECVHIWEPKNFTALCMVVNNPEGTMIIDFGVTENFSKWTNSQIWNPWIMKLDFTFKLKS